MSYSHLLYHIVFATKHRQPWLTPSIMEDVHGYLGGIVRKEGSIPMIINGAIEHVHLLVRIHQDTAISTFLRVLKAKSSGWIHRTYPELGGFGWQRGYSAFTVSRWDRPMIYRYIERQEEHHRKVTFRKEYVTLLKQHGVEYDPKEIWE